uniref:Allergen Act d 3 n=1 Tax=Anthurium amnicola TaxID=1678845 RepID=A0A1D1XF41_9ARAE
MKAQSRMPSYAAAVLLLCATANIALAVTDGLLENGNFEQGPKKRDLKGTEVMGRHAIPGWETSGFVEYIESGHKQGDMLLVVPEGAYAVRLGNEASIKQAIKVTQGMYYSVTFSAARTCAQEEKLNVSVAPDSGVLPMQTMYSSNGWDSYAWAFKAPSPLVELIIHNPGEEEDPACGPLIDSVAIKALYPPRLTNQNLVKNGDFEEGPYVFPNTAWGVLVPPNIEDDHCPLPGWMVESLKAVKYIDAAHFSVPEGRRAIELVAGRESVIAQVARTIPGKVYSLTFSVGDASNSCEGSMVVEAFAGGKDTVKVPYQSLGKGGFKRAILRFTATEARTRIMFFSTFYHTRSDDMSSLCGPVVDDVRLLSIRNP